MAIKFALAAAGIALAFALVSLGSSKSGDLAEADKTLLASMPVLPGAKIVREYIFTQDGDVFRGREYATEQTLPEASEAVTALYNERLARSGWKVIEQHAATSVYGRGDERAELVRYGEPSPADLKGKRIVTDVAPPANAQFFYAVVVSSTAGEG